ncbi:MAG: PhoH family protein, partial [Bacteroidales bacterium]|nr:PhoH family protein [Bacteroidales bacterium]
MVRYSRTTANGLGTRKPKIFVLDTNVILHDYKAIRKFKDNDIVIPVAVVEELDKFKKGTDQLAYNARGFMRDMDRITDGRLFGRDGIPIAKGLGKIKIEPNHPFPDEMKDLFKDDIQDHRILSTAIWIRDNNPGRFVALVTKDINLRMKSKAAGMEVQDYMTDRLEDEKVENSIKEVIIIDNPAQETVQALLFGPNNAISWKAFGKTRPKPNQLYKLRNDKDMVCARFDADKDQVVLVKTSYVYGIKPLNDEQRFAVEACLNPEVKLVSMTGGAGTGKTLIALASALEQARDYDQIILTRPTVVLGNQEIGFLPGDQKTKMSPFIQPLMDNLNVIKSRFKSTSKEAQKLDAMLKEEKLLISPLAYIRGRSLGRVFFICDEAQNLTPNEVKTIITRAGEGTKMVFTGDIFQIDQPYLDQWSNGLTHLNEKMGGQKLFEHVFLRIGERSELSDIAS